MKGPTARVMNGAYIESQLLFSDGRGKTCLCPGPNIDCVVGNQPRGIFKRLSKSQLIDSFVRLIKNGIGAVSGQPKGKHCQDISKLWKSDVPN